MAFYKSSISYKVDQALNGIFLLEKLLHDNIRWDWYALCVFWYEQNHRSRLSSKYIYPYFKHISILVEDIIKFLYSILNLYSMQSNCAVSNICPTNAWSLCLGWRSYNSSQNPNFCWGFSQSSLKKIVQLGLFLRFAPKMKTKVPFKTHPRTTHHSKVVDQFQS